MYFSNSSLFLLLVFLFLVFSSLQKYFFPDIFFFFYNIRFPLILLIHVILARILSLLYCCHPHTFSSDFACLVNLILIPFLLLVIYFLLFFSLSLPSTTLASNVTFTGYSCLKDLQYTHDIIEVSWLE
jgi:hypothetical protein